MSLQKSEPNAKHRVVRSQNRGHCPRKLSTMSRVHLSVHSALGLLFESLSSTKFSVLSLSKSSKKAHDLRTRLNLIHFAAVIQSSTMPKLKTEYEMNGKASQCNYAVLKRKRKHLPFFQKKHFCSSQGRRHIVLSAEKRDILGVFWLVLLVTCHEVKFGLLSSAESAATTECCAYLVNACLLPVPCTYGRMTRILKRACVAR